MTTPQNRESDVTARSKRILTGGIVLVLVLVMVHVLTQYDLFGRGEPDLSDAFDYDESDPRIISPLLLQYDEVRTVATGMRQVRDIAVGPEGRWYVAGDQAIRVFDPNGVMHRELSVPGGPRCIDISRDGKTIALGVGPVVVLMDSDGTVRAEWPAKREDSEVTGIEIDVDSNSVYVAEYPSRLVYRHDLTGKRLTVLGRKEGEGYPGLKAPSPYLSVNMGRDLVWINNPGLLRMEAHSPRGEFQHAWGHDLSKDQTDITGFPGCCNPCDFAILPDGRFVTFEKGKNYETVKVFQKEGVLDAVVATPDAFEPGTRGVAVAATATGDVLVLDPARKTIRVFQKTQPPETP
jgi:hypothetical protein